MFCDLLKKLVGDDPQRAFNMILCRLSIGIDPIDDPLDANPQGQIREHFYDAAVVRKGQFTTAKYTHR